MREWTIKSGEPQRLTLAADARLTQTDYTNDQIWEISIGRGEPPCIALETTYGLRARNVRIFPRFGEGDDNISDPADFVTPITIHQYYPNFLQLSFQPIQDLEVQASYWVPTSQAIAGQVKISNLLKTSRKLRLDWAVLLAPLPEGQRMVPTEVGLVTVLGGNSGGLYPIFLVKGGAQAGSGSFPSLTIPLELPPGSQGRIDWVQAALEDSQSSLEMARSIAARNWEGEFARLEMLNTGRIEIHTGNVDWDYALNLSQTKAFSLFLSKTAHLPAASFVTSRKPDQGYSMRGDASDYSPMWNGQTPLLTYYLARLILPEAPELVRGLLDNFLTSQTENGRIDCKPGLGSQRSQLLATPILAHLAWTLYQYTEDPTILIDVFDPLFRSLQTWFSPEQDRDQDGIPEWSHPIQTGLEEHPAFSHWQTWSQGIDIDTVESPDLCAFLYRECQILKCMAELVGRLEVVPTLQDIAERVKAGVEKSWHEPSHCYVYWDRDAHCSNGIERLGSIQGSGDLPIHRQFTCPVRLQFQIHNPDEVTRRFQIFVHGTGPSGVHRIERISTERFHWLPEFGRATGDRVYAHIEHIKVEGLRPEDELDIFTVGHTSPDLTLLLPLWAYIPDSGRAHQLVQETILNSEKFWQPHGMQICFESSKIPENSMCQWVYLPYNVLIGEGLLSYGYRDEAAELVTHMMEAVTQSLKNEGCFRQYYQAGSGSGRGELDALDGLAPVGFFLDSLGVQIINPRKVILTGFNPFPWPVTVKYRGTTILRQKTKTNVIFPDGQTATVDDPSPYVIALD